MQIKATLSCHYILIKVAEIEMIVIQCQQGCNGLHGNRAFNTADTMISQPNPSGEQFDNM